MRIDLQLHSNYSDGFLTPTELAEFVADHGIKVASLTDHNTVGGLTEFKKACEARGIKAINGLELHVKFYHRKLNFVWYNFDKSSPELHKMLRASQIRRKKLVRNMLLKLNLLKFHIKIDETLDKYNHYTPINYIVKDILAVPHNRMKIIRELRNPRPREEEILQKYFYNKKIGILRESYIDIKKILKLRKKIGGQLILNHPGKHNQMQPELLERLKELGIDGLEVLSPHHSLEAIMYAQHMARKLNFIETGGSDFHLHEGENCLLQNSLDYFKIHSKYLKRVREIIG